MATKKRTYHSPLREQQAERTREQLVAAIVSQLSESGRTDFSFEDIAVRAKVNVRTVYRYFPTRDDLMQVAEQEWEKREPRLPPTLSLADLGARTDLLFRYFDENDELLEAVMRSGLSGEVAERRRTKRHAGVESLVAKDAPALDAREVKKRAAVLRLLIGSSAYRVMRKEMGLTIDEAIDAVKWAMRLLVDDTVRAGRRA